MSSQWDDFVWEDYEPNEVDEKPTTVPTLEKQAAVKVAIALWYRAIVEIPGFNTDDHGEWFNLLLDTVFSWIDALAVPKLLAKSIKQHFRRVDDNIYEWTRHLVRAVSITETYRGTTNIATKALQLVDCIVWHPNERINLVKTARNVFKSDKLNNVQKFHLASAYCLREEIEKIWPTLEKIDHGFADGFALSFYWACFCKKELSTIRNQIFEHVPPNVVNWSAIEYFFDRWNTEQQVRATGYFIDEFGLRFQKLILEKLNKCQRISVLEENIIFIILNYARSEDNEEDAIATWNEFRNLITQDQFVNLLSELLFEGIKDSILTEIWTTARDDCKHRVLNNDYYDFIEKVFKWLTEYEETGLTFLSSVLLYLYRVGVDIKVEITKKPFFIDSCLQLCCSNLNLLDRLLNLCRLDAAASKNFKQSMFKSPYFNERCKTLMTTKRLQMLVELLDFAFSITDPSSTQFLREILSENMKLLNDWGLELYSDGNVNWLNSSLATLESSYPEIVSEFKKNLLLSDEGLRICVNHFVSLNCILPEIIADGLPTDLAAEFKKKIISSPEAIDKLKSMMVNKQSNAAMELIDWYLESKKARKKFRKQLRMV